MPDMPLASQVDVQNTDLCLPVMSNGGKMMEAVASLY